VPWNTSRAVDLKAEFVRRLKSGERMTDLCREYGIHRQTGYEVLRAYEAGGIEGLLPRSRAPKHTPHKTPTAIVQLLVEGRKAHPTWGGKKLKHVLEAQHGVQLPAASTITDILKRQGLLEPKAQRRRRTGLPVARGLREALMPNALWCADYKGQFRLGDGSYCYPLTMTDQFSRKLLCCEGMSAINEEAACDASVRTFRRYGLPSAIRTDNGVPFASTGLAGLSRLSVLWLRLGIELERITPGQPQENGCHERMHRTLKRETARPAQANLLRQQERFDRFQEEFNDVRPHEALGQLPPNSVYEPSARPMPEKLAYPDYPLHDDVLVVRSNGSLNFRRREHYHLTAALAGQEVGIREDEDGRWLITFMRLDLGHIDRKARVFQPLEPAAPSPRA
jgi:transposase InsO family protein